MRPTISDVAQGSHHLGQLASIFRGTRDSHERAGIAAEYARTVQRLIDSGEWEEVPPPEDQLPDEYMPSAFAEFWFHVK